MAGAGALLQADGRPRYGLFADSLSCADGRADLSRDAFGRQRSALARRLGYKQFQYFGGMSRDIIFGCALVDLGYANSVFFYVVDTRSGERFERVIRKPGHVGMQLADNPVDGSSHYRAGNVSISQTYVGTPRSKRLQLTAGDVLEIDALMPEAGFEPMSLCTRAGYHGWVYANKTAGLALQGHITWRGQRHDLAELGAMGHHDFSCGFMRRETWWNWACLSGMAQDANGNRIALGLNLSCGVNETVWGENALWLDGRLVPVGGVVFDFNQDDVLQPWQVRSLDGQVNLRFTPVGVHREKMQALILSGHFQQVFGRFDGEITSNGHNLTVDNVSGFVEDQFVRW